LTGSLFEKEDIVEGKKPRRERDKITAASAAYLNIGLESTAYSVCSCVAPAFGSSSGLALGVV
jgi:hypothetical protein